MRAKETYTAIWYDMTNEVKRETVIATNPDIAESEVRKKYPTGYPGKILTILDSSGNLVVNRMV